MAESERALPLTIERLFSAPSLNGAVPVAPRFVPGTADVSYLAPATDDLQRLDLYLQTAGEGSARRLLDARKLMAGDAGALTDEERAQRERRRFFATGITDYRWHPDGRQLLLVCDGSVFLWRTKVTSPQRITPPGQRQTDARFSPDGRYLAYVHANDLYCYKLADSSTSRLTQDGSETLNNGLADFIAQEEMHRYEGYWFSPDGRHLVYAKVDSSPIDLSHRFEFDADSLRLYPQRYPYAGADNAHVRLFVIGLEDGSHRELSWQVEDDDYLARVDCSNNAVWVQAQSRDQRRLQLRRILFRGQSGDPKPDTVLEEHWPTWINLHENLRLLRDDKQLLWSTEVNGISQLVLYELDADSGKALNPVVLTPDSGRVSQVLHVNERGVTFSGWFNTPTEQHLYQVRFAQPQQLETLTHQPGWYEAHGNDDGTAFVARYASLQQPPMLVTFTTNSSPPESREMHAIGGNRLDEQHPYWPYLSGHSTPELGTLTAVDGQVLHYRLTYPPGFDAARRHPVLIHVYGGPGVQRVRNDWQPLTLQYFARLGYVIFELDNRGSTQRAKAFEDVIHRRLGQAEVADQLTGVDFLRAQGWADPDRIGIFGHSYGGYMTLMCLCQAPGTFRAGVAVAPVTDWALYDTHYTERFLETPATNADGYRDSAVLTFADRLQDPLLLIHGMADDNVLFTHSTALIKALQATGRQFDLMTYPGAKHALQESDVARHRYQLMQNFFVRHIPPGPGS
jgi:dipeptidyl-peptidase 4